MLWLPPRTPVLDATPLPPLLPKAGYLVAPSFLGNSRFPILLSSKLKWHLDASDWRSQDHVSVPQMQRRLRKVVGFSFGWWGDGILSWKIPHLILKGNNLSIIYYTPSLYNLSVSVSKDFHSESRDLIITYHETSHGFGALQNFTCVGKAISYSEQTSEGTYHLVDK